MDVAKATVKVTPAKVLKRKAGYALEPAAKRFTLGGRERLDINGVDVEMEGLSVTGSTKSKVD